MSDGILLKAENVTKVYPGTVALDGVNFNIYEGKVNVLVGENGAGKSTLMKILAGVERATSGHLVLDGQEIAPQNPRDAEQLGIGIIYQELNLFPNMSISENIFVAHERTFGGLVIDHRAQEKRTKELLNRLEQPLNSNTLVADLRIGQQQIVEIAKAIALDVRILIMDEPTSALSNTEVEILFRVINELKSQGVSIVYISHKLEELMAIGDYVTVLRDGNLIAEALISQVDLGWIVDNMVGRDASHLYAPAPHPIGEVILEVDGLTLPRPRGQDFILEDVSFQLHAGEIVGLYGLMGAGRTELFECLLGLHRYSAGSVALDGDVLRSNNAQDRIQQGIMLVPEDRQREGIVQTLSIHDNMLLASLKDFLVAKLRLSARKERQSVKQYVDNLHIKIGNPQDLISSLSGGNQQKVVVAKALLTNPRVLLLDEPTRGIDVGAKQEIFDIIVDLAKQGLAILFVSTELKEVLAISDRIIVMSKGRITKMFDREQATEQKLVEASAIGHSVGHTETGV